MLIKLENPEDQQLTANPGTEVRVVSASLVAQLQAQGLQVRCFLENNLLILSFLFFFLPNPLFSYLTLSSFLSFSVYFSFV